MATRRQVDYATLLEQLLDRGYYSTVNPVVRSLARWEQGAIGARLQQLETEIERLEADDERLQPDNIIFRDLVRDVRETMNTQTRALIEAVAPDLNEQGIVAGEQWFLQTTNPTGLGISFNRPDPEAIRALVDRLQSDAWKDKIAGYADDVADTLQNTIIRGVVLGKNPRATAADIRRFMDTYPRYRAETLMRTMQLTAYREANAAHVVANADIIEVQIRIAALDDRTCLACIALHGTELAVGERVDGHHNCRCTSVAIVKGRPREVVSGEDWFKGLPEERQRTIAGHANHEAMMAGKVKLSDFVKPYEDPLYGRMVNQASLKDILGGRAKDYYASRVPRVPTRPTQTPRSKPIPTAPRRVVADISKIENDIRNQSYETGILYDRNGNLVDRRDGDSSHVRYDTQILERARGGTLTHNHPVGYHEGRSIGSISLSPADVRVAHKYDLSEIRAVGVTPDGRNVLYRITAPPGGWSSTDIDDVISAFRQRSETVVNAFARRVARGADPIQLMFDVDHNAWKSVVALPSPTTGKRFDFRYERIIDD